MAGLTGTLAAISKEKVTYRMLSMLLRQLNKR